MKATLKWRNGFLLIAILGLVGLLRYIGWQKIVTHLVTIGWRGIPLILAAGMAEAFCDALALKAATTGQGSFWKLLLFNQAGALFNMITPGDGGEIVKASLLAKELPGHGISSTVVWNVAFRLSKSIVILGTSLFAFSLLPAHRFQAKMAIGLSLLGLLIYVGLNLVVRQGWTSKILSLLSRLPLVPQEALFKVARHTQDVEKKATLFRHQHPRYAIRIILYQSAARLCDFTGTWLILHLLGTQYPVALCALVFAGVQLTSYLLPFLPTKVGATEGSAYLLFSFLGLDGGVGVILQIVMRLKQLIINATGLFGTFL